MISKLLPSTKKIKSIFLALCLFFLVFPNFAFAACGDINSVGMFNFAIVVVILFAPFFLLNMEYIKASFESGKTLALNFAPLIIFPIASYIYVSFFSEAGTLPQQIFFNTLDKTIGLLIIYYILLLFYGVSQFHDETRAKGGDIIKFSVSIIIAFSAIYGFIKIIINMSGC